MILYRYVDEFYGRNDVKISEQRYEVVKETDKGYWISRVYNGNIFPPSTKKWISKYTHRHKRFAFESKDDAMKHFLYRKRSQVRILEHRLKLAKLAFYKASQQVDEKIDLYVEDTFHISSNRKYFPNPLSISLGNMGFLKNEDVEIM